MIGQQATMNLWHTKRNMDIVTYCELMNLTKNLVVGFKNGKLSDERVSKLNEIGFVWDMSHVVTTRKNFKSTVDALIYWLEFGVVSCQFI